jgi:hypothetical protein
MWWMPPTLSSLIYYNADDLLPSESALSPRFSVSSVQGLVLS